MLDKAAENRLLDNDFEFSSKTILSAADLALLKINEGHIIKTSYTIDSCPGYMLLLGTVYFAMGGRVAQKARNRVSASDGGMLVDREGNVELYYRIQQNVLMLLNEEIDREKGWENISAGFS